MAGPLAACFVVVDETACTRKAMKAVEYNLAKLPEILNVQIAFTVPMCGYHLGVVYDNGADFIRAMDQLVDDGIPLTDEEAEGINHEIHQELTRVRRTGTEAPVDNGIVAIDETETPISGAESD